MKPPVVFLIAALSASACNLARSHSQTHSAEMVVIPEQAQNPDLVFSLVIEENFTVYKSGNGIGGVSTSILPSAQLEDNILVLETLPNPLPKASAIFLSSPLSASQIEQVMGSGNNVPVAVISGIANHEYIQKIVNNFWKATVSISEGGIVITPMSAEKYHAGQALKNLGKPSNLGISMPLLESAEHILRRTCDNARFRMETIEVYTANSSFDGALNPLIDFEFHQAVPEMGIFKDEKIRFVDTDMTYSGHPFMHHGTWDLSFELKPELFANAKFTDFAIYVSGHWDISNRRTQVSISAPENSPNCVSVDIWMLYDRWLNSALFRLMPPPGPIFH